MNIAARVVEIVSGMSYEEFLQKRFFDPLGMKETTFWPTEAQAARLGRRVRPEQEKGWLRPGRRLLPDQAVLRPGSPLSRGRRRSVLHHARHPPVRPDAGKRPANLTGKRLFVARGDGRIAEGADREDEGQLRAWAIISATACSATTGHTGPTFRLIPRQGWWLFSWCSAPAATSGAARDLFLKTAAKVFPK